MVCPEALGVGPPSLGSADSALMGELISAPPLTAGDDWKKSGEEAGGSCDEF
jgi:hypothetical protein